MLVLGAGGFLGHRLVPALAAAERWRPVSGVRRMAAAGQGERILLDATDAAQVRAALMQVDAVVNCVAGTPRTIVAGATALFDTAAAMGRPVIHLSSMAVYGAAAGIVDDAAPLAGRGGYAGAKIAAERIARAAGGVAVLRPGCIYGGGSPQWTRRIAALLRAGRIGDLGRQGRGCSNIVHVDDVVAAIIALLDRPAGAVTLNLAMPAAPDWNGYFRAFAAALGLAPVARVPAWRLRAETLAALPIEAARGIGIDAPPAITPSLAGLWRQPIRLDSAAAETRLGLAWTPLAVGLAEAAASVRVEDEQRDALRG